MTRLTFAEQLEAAANLVGDTPRAELQILLRRAALMLRNIEGVSLDPEWDDALNSVAGELGLSRGELIRAVIRDWLIANAYVPVHIIDEESETDGSA